MEATAIITMLRAMRSAWPRVMAGPAGWPPC
ncbi:Uncharacterised protein [Bordetella pertussis]|nr:Uncharacterised protein [Bordetella pertussis]